MKPLNREMTVRSLPQESPRGSFPTLVGIVATVAALYLGRDIFLPLAIAILLTFALAPVVSWLRKLHVPRPVAVISVVFGAFVSIFLFSAVVATQIGSLAQNLPVYQSNIETKVQSIKDASVGAGLVNRVSQLLERLGNQIGKEPQPKAEGAAPSGEQATAPLPVEVIEPKLQPLQLLQTIIEPLIQPLATGGIIVVVVIFMLLKREDLRDRFIRLVGAGDLHRTTAALQEAGGRVGQYLLMQLVVNITYAVPLGIGLWVIGVPNAALWGLMALLLRFVPYIGPIIASIFPLALALAVDPGWTMVLWTAALFIVIELATNNVIEPWLYGSRTGISPLAIIVAAIFWTWLWGPLGLLLSTPLTVCLVVLGRHVPQFEFLDVLFGNEPVLEPDQQIYQRFLAGDAEEATDRAEMFLEDNDLITFYETVAIPALALGEFDRARGVLADDRRIRVAESAIALVENLEEYADEEAAEDEGESAAILDKPHDNDPAVADEAAELPDGTGKTVLCAGGRGELDDAAAAMLSQVLTVQGATARLIGHHAMEPVQIRKMDLSGVDAVVIGFLNAGSVVHARYMVRRLKRSRSSLRVGVVFWTPAEEAQDDVKLGASINCDFIARTMAQAVIGALADETAVRLKPPVRKVVRRKPKIRSKAKEPV